MNHMRVTAPKLSQKSDNKKSSDVSCDNYIHCLTLTSVNTKLGGKIKLAYSFIRTDSRHLGPKHDASKNTKQHPLKYQEDDKNGSGWG